MHPKLCRLADLAEREFSAGSSATPALSALTAELESLTCADLEADLAALDRGVPWTERLLFERPDLHASLFLVPAGRELPLHDHPEMTVLLRVLAGRLEIRSFDWVPGTPGMARARPARTVRPGDRCDVLGPRDGNLHHLRALEDTVFVDLFSPYYDEAAGRPCSYFRTDGEVEVDGDVLVRMVEAPELDPERAQSR
jgi:cysteamine dioxygenase